MTNDVAQSDPRMAAPWKSRLGTVLVLGAIANALVIHLVAVNHSYSPALRSAASAYHATALYHYEIFLEALTLTLPGVALGILFGRHWPRTGLVLGGIFIACAPLVYFADLQAELIAGSRLFSSRTWRLMGPAFGWMATSLTWLPVAKTLAAAAGYGAVQAAVLWLAYRAASRLEISCDPRQRRLAVLLGVLLVGPAVWLAIDAQQVVAEWRFHPDRHPICATGLIAPPTYGVQGLNGDQSGEWIGRLVGLHEQQDRAGERYQALHLAAPPKQRPDIVLVIGESLRYDAWTPQSAPFLHELRKKSLTSRFHSGGGNGTEFGLFTALSGLDSTYYERAVSQQWDLALLKSLREAGYHRAFLGNAWDRFQTKGIDKFLTPEVFETYQLLNAWPFSEGDSQLIGEAQEILARRGRFASLKDQPVFVLLFLYTTHFPYHSLPEDRVYMPSLDEAVFPQFWDEATLLAVRNTYFNSVRCLDRMLRPLGDHDAALLVMGDHGESFRDDHGALHAGMLSAIQTRTSILMRLPGGEAGELPGPTFHGDVLPTILDLWQTELSDPETIQGRSWLRPDAIAARPPFSIRESRSNTYVLARGLPTPENTRWLQFHCDPWLGEFRPQGVFDGGSRPIPATDQDAEAFANDLKRWLETVFLAANKVESADPFPRLLRALREGPQSERQWACETLREMRQAAAPAYETLLEYCQSPDSQLREAAFLVLRNLDPPAPNSAAP